MECLQVNGRRKTRKEDKAGAKVLWQEKAWKPQGVASGLGCRVLNNEAIPKRE